jgi:hypothetical protein
LGQMHGVLLTWRYQLRAEQTRHAAANTPVTRAGCMHVGIKDAFDFKFFFLNGRHKEGRTREDNGLVLS